LRAIVFYLSLRKFFKDPALAKVKSSTKKSEDKLLDLVEVQQKTKSFFEHNQQRVSIIGGAILLVISRVSRLLFFCIKNQGKPGL
jgi:hypothetical protein